MAKRVTDDEDGPGKSNVPADIILLHSRAIERAKADLDSANGTYRSTIKAAKSAGVNTKPLLNALKAKKGDPAMADLELRDEIRYRAILNVPVSWAQDGQGQMLFGDEVSADAEDARDEFDDIEDGKKAGLDGHSLTTNPHEAGTERYQNWAGGWKDGQTELLKKGQKKQSATKPSKRRGSATPPVH